MRRAAGPHVTLLQRVRRWRVGTQIPIGGGVVLAFGGVVLMMSPQLLLFGGTGGAQIGTAFPAAMFPCLVALASLRAQWAMLGMELLRPVSRKAFLRERALAAVWQVGEYWLGAALAMVAGAALMNPWALGLPRFWGVLGLSWLGLMLVMPGMFWLLRFRSVWVMMAGAMLAVLPMVPCQILLDRPESVEAGFVLPGVAAAVVMSAVVLWDARRRWMGTELE